MWEKIIITFIYYHSGLTSSHWNTENSTALTYITINGIGINLLNKSLFYCKFRPFYVQLRALVSFSCMDFAITDQFFGTCSRPRRQQWCNIKVTRYLLAGIGIVYILYEISSSIMGKYICTTMNVVFQRYHTFFSCNYLFFKCFTRDSDDYIRNSGLSNSSISSTRIR